MNVKLKSLTMAATVAVAALSVAGAAHARDQIQIAGSSTVLPYANIVAEQFGQTFPQFKTPIVESGGSSGGLKQFCGGIGANHIDIANSSRPIKSDEKDACAAAGVTDIIEVRFGYDGIVFASDVNGPDFAFTPTDWFLALGAQVPVDGKLADNPNQTWKDVNSSFPGWKIAALIPGEKHGTREVF
ncbi:MAG: substrate-binding domain-containing protein, partial [Alphaproteobacteria bacterium]|nr:substrate-binding domain-containing protein [Alphaproteobacteria bacterium]